MEHFGEAFCFLCLCCVIPDERSCRGSTRSCYSWSRRRGVVPPDRISKKRLPFEDEDNGEKAKAKARRLFCFVPLIARYLCIVDVQCCQDRVHRSCLDCSSVSRKAPYPYLDITSIPPSKVSIIDTVQDTSFSHQMCISHVAVLLLPFHTVQSILLDTTVPC